MSTSFSESDPRTTTPVANLSRTGVLVVAPPTVPIGSRIELCFTVFPDRPLLFRHTGRVVRHVGQPPSMGVEFDPLTPQLEALVDEILQRARKRTRRRRELVRFDAHELRARLLDD